jgi:hypothetical protein
MTDSWRLALVAVYVLVYLPMIGWAYGRQRRWLGLAGWAVLMAGLLLAFGGAGDWLAWGGLLWAYLAAAGGLLVIIDLAEVRYRRRG